MTFTGLHHTWEIIFTRCFALIGCKVRLEEPEEFRCFDLSSWHTSASMAEQYSLKPLWIDVYIWITSGEINSWLPLNTTWITFSPCLFDCLRITRHAEEERHRSIPRKNALFSSISTEETWVVRGHCVSLVGRVWTHSSSSFKTG